MAMTFGPGPKPVPPHRRGMWHRAAETLVQYLRDEGGSTALANKALAATLGMTPHTLRAARLHIFTCPELNAVVAYRMPGGPLTLFDLTGTAILQSLPNRSVSALAGYDNQHRNTEIIRLRCGAIVEGEAMEALARGERDLADALTSAANDIRTTGGLHPMTRAQLRALGAIT